ncbi:hypothetical protein HanIR_Chr09g0430961 [Helianthus annuus]|nr:hypothetical protein HanIR_Chr09g0430961 [Helianthus annuus]
MLTISQTFVLLIVFSLFIICIDGNNNDADYRKVDLASANFNFHKVNQQAFTSNLDRGNNMNGICVPKFGGCGSSKVCFCCLKPHGFCVPSADQCQTLCT